MIALTFWHDLRVGTSVNPAPPTLDNHPGAALFAKYKSFAPDEIGLRDRWFQRLDTWQRDQYNHYRMLLRSSKHTPTKQRLSHERLVA